jgi:hypothetical protein
MDLLKLNIQQINPTGIENTDIASKASVNTVQANVTAANTWVNANDYTTLLTARSNDYATLLSAQSNDYTTLLSARSNDYSTLLTAQANDYNSYTTLNSRINTVQDNVGSSSSNTNIYLGSTLVSNTALIFETSNGISISGNTTSKVITFSIGMSNVTSQEFTANGAANAFTLAKSVANSHMILVSYNGILQKPTTYVIAGTTLTLSNTLPIESGSDIEVRFFDFFDLPGATSGGGGGGYSFQGTVSGYTSGGNTGAAGTNTIDKFPFATNGNATDVGDLTQIRIALSGQSSDTSGYSSGGAPSNVIDKFPFAANANATDVGDLLTAGGTTAGQSSSTHGYTARGNYGNSIEKFSFTTDGNATDVGDSTASAHSPAGQSSSTNGYISGGQGVINIIENFPFAANANATDVGDLTQARYYSAGQSSTTSGYTSGGAGNPVGSGLNTIDKFPFASNANATDVGDLTQARWAPSGQSSDTNGYSSGGFGQTTPTLVVFNIIDKFPFASDGNATDVGDLTVARRSSAGQQV